MCCHIVASLFRIQTLIPPGSGMKNSMIIMICDLSVGGFIASACCRHNATEEKKSEYSAKKQDDEKSPSACKLIQSSVADFLPPIKGNKENSHFLGYSLTSIICFFSGSSQV